MIKNRLFIGEEAEGPQKGLLTLFIPKHADNRYSFLIFADYYKITRLYFGAGNDRGIHHDMISQLQDIPRNFTVYLEIQSDDDLIDLPIDFLIRTKIIYVLKSDYFKALPSVFKIETKSQIHWYELLYPYTNKINDKIYEKDIDL